MLPLSARNLFCRLAVLLLLAVGWPQAAGAEPAANCHCFRDRAYNPAARFAADEYLLVTIFNGLISRFFDIPKREVVMLKMQGGVDQNDLLLAYYIAKITATDPQGYLARRRDKQSWQAILSGPAMAAVGKNNPLLAAIKSGVGVKEGGRLVAETMIAAFFAEPPATIAAFHAAGLVPPEITLALLLAHTAKQQPQHLVDLHKKAGQSWSEIAHGLGLEPAAVGKLILDYKHR